MFLCKRRAIANNPHQLEASWQSIMQFPLYDIDNNVEKVASQSKLPIHLIFGKCTSGAYIYDKHHAYILYILSSLTLC